MQTARTLILVNGNRFHGEPPDSIGALIERLAQEPLDPRFVELRPHSPFYQVLTEADFLPEDNEFMHEWIGATHFYGNFLTVSHPFEIITHDKELIVRLGEAIEENCARLAELTYSAHLPTGRSYQRVTPDLFRSPS